MKHVMNWKVLVFKYLAIIGTVASGLMSGYDGPMVLVGTIVAILLITNISRVPRFNDWFYGENRIQYSKTVHISRQHSSQMRPVEAGEDETNVLKMAEKRFLRIFASAGAACGLASVFKSPLGGVLFALEEAMSFYEPAMLIRTFFSTLATVLLIAALNYWKYGALYGYTYSLWQKSANCLYYTTV